MTIVSHYQQQQPVEDRRYALETADSLLPHISSDVCRMTSQEKSCTDDEATDTSSHKMPSVASPPAPAPPCVVSTGIDIPMCFNKGVQSHSSSAPTSKPEPLCEPSGVLVDVLRWESRRIQHLTPAQNRIVYEAVDVNPERPYAHVKGTVDDMQPYYMPADDTDYTLVFDSRFEAGNLRRVVQVQEFEYDLILNPDYNTKCYTQWFYFSVANTRAGCQYRINIINMVKSTSLYNEGMRPLFYSTKHDRRWRRTGHNIAYYQNGKPRRDKGNYYTLTFTVEFMDDDLVYLAHSEPYTYTHLQTFLRNLEQDPKRLSYFRMRRRKLCETLAGNSCDLITITSFRDRNEDDVDIKDRPGVVFTARVHPGETSASWVMKGVIDYLTSSSHEAKLLRDNFVFKIVPMLNPDGVIVGNYRSSLCGLDLNRQWQMPSKKITPTIYYAKQMIQRLCECRDVVLYIDIHGHSRKKNIFMYGNNAPSAKEKIFPRLLAGLVDYFSIGDCSFQVKKNKKFTARAVVYNEFEVYNSYTLEASLCGADTGQLANYHFNRANLEQMGWRTCEAILQLCDPAKVTQAIKELGAIPSTDNCSDYGDSETEENEKRVRTTPETMQTRESGVRTERGNTRRSNRSSRRNIGNLKEAKGAKSSFPMQAQAAAAANVASWPLQEGKRSSKKLKPKKKEPEEKTPKKKRHLSISDKRRSGRINTSSSVPAEPAKIQKGVSNSTRFFPSLLHPGMLSGKGKEYKELNN